MAIAGRPAGGGLMEMQKQGGGGFMSGLAGMLKRPELYQWLGGVGAGLSRASQGRGYDISQANQQLFTSMRDRKASEGLMDMMGQTDLSPEQHTFLRTLPLEMQQRVLAGYLLPQQGERRILKDAAGFQRYPDSGERVFPDAVAGPGQGAVWQQKMQEMIANGTDPYIAAMIASGQWGMTVEGTMVDKGTGRPPTYGGGPQPTPSIETQTPRAPQPESDKSATLWGSLDKATGAIRAFQHLSTDTVGQLPIVGDWVSFPETVEARRLFDTSVRDLARALANNPRYPVGEMQDIIKRSGLEASAWVSEDSTRAGLVMFDGYLRDKINKEREFLARSDISTKQRNEGIRSIKEMRAFLQLMGAPRGAGGPELGTAANPIDMRASSYGDTPADIDEILKRHGIGQ